MKVMITAGAYGYKPEGSSFSKPIYQGQVVEVDDAEGEYLLSHDEAILVIDEESPASATGVPLPDVSEASAVGNLSEDENGQETASGGLQGESLEDMSFEELKILASELGLDTKGLRSKAALREAIASALDDSDDTGEALPDIGASGVIL